MELINWTKSGEMAFDIPNVFELSITGRVHIERYKNEIMLMRFASLHFDLVSYVVVDSAAVL